MLLCPVRKPEKGFTLIEIITVTIIVGIVAAVSIPSLLGLLNRNRVNQAMAEVEGALKEAQKIATRNGKSCTISIDATAKTISNNTANDQCLLSTRFIDNNFTLTTNRATIAFSGKGNISLNPRPVIVLSYPTGGVSRPKCVVIQNTLGSIRTGTYNGTIPSPPVEGSCVNN